MQQLWVFSNNGEPFALCVNNQDKLIIRYKSKTVAVYDEVTENWIGYTKTGLKRVHWDNFRKIAVQFIE